MNLLPEASSVDQLNEIGKWAQKTQDGSKRDLSLQPLPMVWELVESGSGNCLGRKCRDYDRCFYFKARKAMYGAQLLVVNHALFFSDLALRRAGVGLLPEYKVVIFDEAHTLEDVAADHLGIQVGQGTMDYLLNKLWVPRTGKGLLALCGDDESIHQCDVARQSATAFFELLAAWRDRHHGG